MKNIIFVIGIISSVLTGCASNPISGTKEPLIAANDCMKTIGPSFMEDGHLYTTLSITNIAQYPDNRQLVLSYYSQYPDLDLNYDAVSVSFKYLLLPWEWKWRNDVTGGLHSLHSGNRAAIDERRKNIKNILSQTIKNPDLDWISGLVIHAYGDSYAHTKNVYNSENEQAYGPWIGHAIPSLLGHNPDIIKSELTEPKYIGYANALYATLKLDDNNDANFNNFLEFIHNLKCEKDVCPDFNAAFNKEKLVNSRIDKFTKCMNSTARHLSREEVQKAINLIKDGNMD